MPARKSGLWNVTLNPADGAEQQFHECVERESDRLAAHGATDCSRSEVRREGARVLTESVCKADGSTRIVRGNFVGNLDSAFGGELSTTYQPALEGKSEETARYHARWIGPCKRGQKPGDRVTIEAPLIRRALEYGAKDPPKKN